jgi:hypothetical protein
LLLLSVLLPLLLWLLLLLLLTRLSPCGCEDVLIALVSWLLVLS